MPSFKIFFQRVKAAAKRGPPTPVQFPVFFFNFPKLKFFTQISLLTCVLKILIINFLIFEISNFQNRFSPRKKSFFWIGFFFVFSSGIVLYESRFSSNSEQHFKKKTSFEKRCPLTEDISCCLWENGPF